MKKGRHTSGGAGRDSSAKQAFVGSNVHLNSGVSSGIKDLTSMNLLDGHVGFQEYRSVGRKFLVSLKPRCKNGVSGEKLASAVLVTDQAFFSSRPGQDNTGRKTRLSCEAQTVGDLFSLRLHYRRFH